LLFPLELAYAINKWFSQASSEENCGLGAVWDSLLAPMEVPTILKRNVKCLENHT
jgi:hypothetical protein